MKANGRRAWRKYAKREQRRAVGQDFYWTHDARGNVAAHGRRHLKQFGPRPPARPFTPRSLVGMSQRRRKALFHVEFDAAREKNGTVSMFFGDALLSKYRIGQRLRPCPGCPGCDEPRSSVRQLRGWVRLAGLRLFAWKRIATEPCNGFTGRWSAGWTVRQEAAALDQERKEEWHKEVMRGICS